MEINLIGPPKCVVSWCVFVCCCVHFSFKMENLMRFTRLFVRLFVIESPVLAASNATLCYFTLKFVLFLLCMRLPLPQCVYSFYAQHLVDVWCPRTRYIHMRLLRKWQQHIVKWKHSWQALIIWPIYTQARHKDVRASDEMSSKQHRFRGAHVSE